MYIYGKRGERERERCVCHRSIERKERRKDGQKDRRTDGKKDTCIAPIWYHRVSSSVSGFPKKPPTSEPQKGSPAREIERRSGMEERACSQLAALSPVQMAPNFWEPAKNARDRTNGRSFCPSFRRTRPFAVAWCM